jgi:hypothetical protein
MLKLLIYPGLFRWGMVTYLTESDRQRMSEFAATPKYERDPEMLIPDDD